MLGELWNRLVDWTGAVVAPDWSSLVALIPILLLLAVSAFLLITAAAWIGAGPAQRGSGRRPPRSATGRPVRAATTPPLAVACGAFTLAFGLASGGPWAAGGAVLMAAGLAWWVVSARRGRPA